MSIDTFLIRIVLLVIPGLAGYKTFRTLQSTGKSRKQIKDWQDILSIAFLSVLSYGLLFLVYATITALAKCIWKSSILLSVTSIDALVSKTVSLNFFEIVYASILSMLVGLTAGIFYNKKILFRIARALHVTQHYGDDDVWSYVTNSDDVEWLFVRDHKVGLVYYGSLSIFSESDEKRELLLEDVDVYDNANGKWRYHADSLYICREDDELTLEIPKQRRYVVPAETEAAHGKPTQTHSGRNRKEGGR